MLYSFSAILLFIMTILLPKTKQKLNIIKAVVMQLVLCFAYHTLVCYLLNFINIPITLQNLSIVNLVIIAIFLYVIIEKKQIQTYEIKKRDIAAVLLLIMIVVITVAINFRGLSRIRYISMDSFVHYKAAREFSENTTLFDKAIENTTTSKAFMPMAYVNIGILFKVAKPYMGSISLYNLYILFETVNYFLVGMIFYFCLQEKIKNKNQWWIASLFSVFYLIGYPLNALICGFHYLILGILYVTAIFLVFSNSAEQVAIPWVGKLIIVSLLNLGLICSYALFCPAIYVVELVYFIQKYKQDKKKLVLFILVALLLTGMIGSDISLYQRIKELGNVGIELDGWIYQNCFTNLLLFIPFTVYYLLTIRKEKGKSFERNMVVFFAFFVVILLLGTKMKICSNYYYYKTYYILWFFMLYMHTSGMLHFLEKSSKKQEFVNLFAIAYTFLFILFITLVETPIQTELEAEQSKTNVMEIYTFNKTNMEIEIPFVSKEEIALLKQLEDRIQNKWKPNPSILMLANNTQEKWLQALTGYYHTIYPNAIEEISKWNKGQYEYLLVLEKRSSYSILKERINLQEAEIIMQNEGGTLYQRKKVE